MSLNLRGRVRAQVPHWETFDERGRVGKIGRHILNTVGLQFAHQLLMSCAIGLPEAVEPPRRHRARIYRGDVGKGQNGEQLQHLDCSDAVCQRARGCRIIQVARIHHG